MTYATIGLDSQLRAKDGIAGRPRRFTTGNQFDSQNDANIIDTPKVRTLEFGKLKGGTCSLGGTADGDGVLSVSEQAGTEIVRLDKAGITVNHGSITLNDTAGSTVIDSKGVVSTTQFSQNNTIIDALNQNIAGTATEDVTNSEYSLVLGRATLCYFPFTVQHYLIENGASHNCDAQIFFNINGTVPGAVGRYITTNTGNTSLITSSCYYLEEIGAGTATIKLQARLSRLVGTASMTIVMFRSSYITFGK